MPEGIVLDQPANRFVLHIDMDSFYASAEVARNPNLMEKPVIVGTDPREGKGRGVVVACNYVARSFGVRSAMPISQAWSLCPTAVYLWPDFAYYERLSEQVMRIIRGYAGRFEQVSIDEAFLDVTSAVKGLSEATELVARLKNQLRKETGLTCSVGVAESKTAAKIATDLNKPDKVTIVPRGGTKEFLAPLPVKRIPGVGQKTERLLHELGMVTISDLQKSEPSTLSIRLGKSGLWLWEVANGMDRTEVRERPIKSLSTERTFYEDTADWKVVEEVVDELSSELAERAKSYRYSFGRVGIKVRFRGFETHTREKMLPAGSEGVKVIPSL
jgi:DNA polymerase IV (DinB-like DNA polymerase)